MARRKRKQLDPQALGPEEIVLDTLFVLMRQCSTAGVHSPATEETAERLRVLVEQAELPLALQFRGENAYRDQVLVPLRAEVFRRSQPLLESLANLSVREIVFDTVPPLESLLKLAEALVKGSHGPNDAVRRARFPHIAVRTRRRVLPKDFDEPTERRHEATTRIAHALGTADELPRHPDREWPWSTGIALVRHVEEAVAADPYAAVRTLEHVPGAWTVPRRAVSACLRASIALARLGADLFARRSAAHAVLVLAVHGYGERSGKPAPEAGELAVASLVAAAALSPSGITAHRLRVTTIVHALARAAVEGGGEPALLGLVRAAYEMERQRCPVEIGFALTNVDLVARAAGALASEGAGSWTRVLLAAVGPVPPGAYVIADGRLGIVYEPADDAWRPKVQVGNEIFVPREPVQLFSPIAMAQTTR